MKTLLVTGGCGFIGSAFIRLLLSRTSGYRIINLDKLTYCGNPANTRMCEGNARYEFVQGDICDRALVGSLIQRVHAVVNFAAETHVDRSIEHSDDFVRTNVIGVKTLLDAALEHPVERFVQVSTDEVYGSIVSGAFTESSPLEPNSPYSASKAAGDLLARSYGVTYHVPVLITRSSNNYGPYQYPEKIIPLFMTNLIEGKRVPLYAQGENVREWLYVEDHCRAIERVLEQGNVGEIYNIGSGIELSNLSLTRAILGLFGKDESWITSVKDRPGHDLRYSLDCSKIRALGFKPQYAFEQALATTRTWYEEHRDWWQPLKNNKYTQK